MTTAAASGAGNIVTGIVVALIALAAYLAPSIVAATRRVPNTGSVIVVNVFLGWTLVGWVVALAMAVRSKPPPAE